MTTRRIIRLDIEPMPRWGRRPPGLLSRRQVAANSLRVRWSLLRRSHPLHAVMDRLPDWLYLRVESLRYPGLGSQWHDGLRARFGYVDRKERPALFWLFTIWGAIRGDD